jgi:hypothetical protein
LELASTITVLQRRKEGWNLKGCRLDLSVALAESAP